MVLMLVAAFAAGFGIALALATAAVVFLAHFLLAKLSAPPHLSTDSSNPGKPAAEHGGGNHSPTDWSCDSSAWRLAGWVRIAEGTPLLRPAPSAINPASAFAAGPQSHSVLSSIFARVVGRSPSTTSIVGRYVMLKNRHLFLYEDDSRCICVGVLVLARMHVTFCSAVTSEVDCYSKELPIRVSMTAPSLQPSAQNPATTSPTIQNAVAHDSQSNSMSSSVYSRSNPDLSSQPLRPSSLKISASMSEMNRPHSPTSARPIDSESAASALLGAVELLETDYLLYFDSAREKERWFFALRAASSAAETESAVPTLFFKNWAATTPALALGKSDLSWLNAIVARIFLGIHSHPRFVERMLAKAQHRISRLALPVSLTASLCSPGISAPVFSNPELLLVCPSTGSIELEINLHYNGGASLALATRLGDLPISLTLALRLLAGRMRIIIPPPPSTRLWYAFVRPPLLDFSVDPVLYSTAVRINPLLDLIRRHFMGIFNRTLILPNMDEFCFFSDSPSNPSGGLFYPFLGKPQNEEHKLSHSTDTSFGTKESRGVATAEKVQPMSESNLESTIATAGPPLLLPPSQTAGITHSFASGSFSLPSLKNAADDPKFTGSSLAPTATVISTAVSLAGKLKNRIQGPRKSM